MHAMIGGVSTRAAVGVLSSESGQRSAVGVVCCAAACAPSFSRAAASSPRVPPRSA